MTSFPDLPEDALPLGESFFYWNFQPDFGPWLRARREEKGLNLRKAATELGLSFGNLQMIETGKRTRPPSLELLHRIAEVFGQTTGEVRERAGVNMVDVSSRYTGDNLDRTFEALVMNADLCPNSMSYEALLYLSPLQKRQWIEFALRLEAYCRGGGKPLDDSLCAALQEAGAEECAGEPLPFTTW